MQLVLCDNNRILCEALGTALGRFGHQVAASTTNTVQGIAAVAAYRPGACLFDLRFPEPPDGLEAARVIRQRQPQTAVLLLSGYIDEAARAAAMRLGVVGVLRKDQNVEHIAEALDVIAAGGVIFDSVLVPVQRTGERQTGSPVCLLTPREREVLTRMVAGQSTVQMSREMVIEVSTLRTYVKNVLAKLGAHSRLEAAAVATREGLLDQQAAAHQQNSPI
jgi:two-component system nitrate/nitrite response regulator NarL